MLASTFGPRAAAFLAEPAQPEPVAELPALEAAVASRGLYFFGVVGHGDLMLKRDLMMVIFVVI